MDLGSTVKDLFEMYQQFQQAHPHIGTMLTTEAILLTSDASSQLIKDKKINKKKLGYTAALAPLYSLCMEGLMESGTIVGKTISENPLVKAALGPNLLGNAYNLIFFANNTLGEKHNYNITEVAKTYYKKITDNTTSLKEKFTTLIWDNVPKKPYAYAVGATLTFWNLFQAANYEYVPEELRVPAALSVGLFWTLGLTYASLIGSRKIATQTIEQNQSTEQYKNSKQKEKE